ncbi:flagellar hook assembly protein FlgD [Teredinibacter turnerae]|uniref:Basal-body rod modification protein FlgD n=1 Tax=Teredinibacter turnerae (strain ATCC 39867 / T7901) TaxID=377629 RepID=C5BRR9_TERTT|nr:flagellar hook assembly protein FlgD [Teredinibacter turnerae]ACR14597.1 flagellar basal-body rod modification protein FlgD [Teredinibacter turnerae T7901]
MNDVSSVNNNPLSDYSIANKTKEEPKSNELGQSAFLELMITQMENQDPLSPQENTEFIAQLAQFSSVEALDKLNNNFDSFTNNFMANQALQASTLVGRSVTVPAEQTYLQANDLVTTSVEIPSSTSSVNMNIYSESGALVEQIPLGSQPAGEMVVRWDGLNAEVNGELLDWQSSAEEGVPPGLYRFEVTAQLDGESTQLDTAVSANVNSVTVGTNGGLVLNLAGIGAVDIGSVKQFNE